MDDIVIISSLEGGIEYDLYLEAFREQLEASDISTRIIHESEVHRSLLCNGRGFIFHDVRFTDRMRRFVEEGKRINKTFYLLHYEHQNSIHDDFEGLLDHKIAIGQQDKQREVNSFYLKNKLSEKVLSKLYRDLPYKKRNSIYLDVTPEMFEEIAGTIERFLNVNKGRRLYTVQDVDLDLFSKIAQEKVRYIDTSSVDQIIKAVNHSRVAIIEERNEEIFRLIKMFQQINRTPIIEVDSGNYHIDKEILEGNKNIDSELFKRSYKSLHENGSMYNTQRLRDFILDTMKPSVGINIPGGKVGGGVTVAIKHGEILQRNGYDVTMLSDQNYDHQRFYEIEGRVIPGVSRYTENIKVNFDKLVATLWNTVEFVSTYNKVRDRYYLIQGYETDFSGPGKKERVLANRTYFNQNIKLLTVSPWCINWLKDEYGRIDAKLVLNGMNLTKFPFKKREKSGKFKILIEGNPEEPFRGVDEAFKIVNGLDRNKFEIHFLSARESIKDWYMPDKKFFSIPHSEVSEVFTECDLLLKCSVLESFSYPPLEMMATGGVCVIARNDGNSVYARDGENCYMYDSGDIEKARNRIIELSEDRDIFDRFVDEGVITVKKFSWDELEQNLIDAYEID